MSFLAGLLPAIGGLLPGIVKTVGNVIGKVTSGDFSGALGEVGKALTGGAGDALSTAANQTAQALEKKREQDVLDLERKRKEQQEDFERELENKRKLMHLEFEAEARKRQLDSAQRINPSYMFRGRSRYLEREPVPLRAPQQQVSEPYEDSVDAEEVEYERPLPRTTKKYRNKKRKYRY